MELVQSRIVTDDVQRSAGARRVLAGVLAPLDTQDCAPVNAQAGTADGGPGAFRAHGRGIAAHDREEKGGFGRLQEAVENIW